MKISGIVSAAVKPELYELGNAIMWTDEHISKQLLETHLNPELDLASRKPETIEKTVDWILSKSDKPNLDILDLGCGPGLYAEILAGRGHNVTGVDFSENSIRYAREEAKAKNLSITYLHESYLDLYLQESQFDLVLLVYTDFGPLLPDERIKLLSMIKRVLRPGGVFIFDVLNDNDVEGKLSPRNWEVSEKGFWKNDPYLALSESFLYEKEKVILYQHIVTDELDNVNYYRFWNHFFSKEDVSTILAENGFPEMSFYDNILPSGFGYSSDDVTFCIVINE